MNKLANIGNANLPIRNVRRDKRPANQEIRVPSDHVRAELLATHGYRRAQDSARFTPAIEKFREAYTKIRPTG